MTMTVFVVLGLAALIGAIVHAYDGRYPLWVSVALLSMAELLRAWPLGR